VNSCTRNYDATILQALCKSEKASALRRQTLSHAIKCRPGAVNFCFRKELLMKQESLKKMVLAAALLSLSVALPMAVYAAGTADNATASKSANTGMTTSKEKSANSGMNNPNAQTVSSSDKKFVEKASQGGAAEVQFGKLAEQKAQSAEVKQFGQRMVKDHSAANDKLTQLAGKKGIAPAADMDSSSKREYDKLSKLSGAQFDKEYMKTMVSDHEKDIKEFKSEAKSGKDADIKNFAESTVPTLEEHLKQAKTAEAAAKAEKTASK
jgi:putative membrane protein